MTKKLAHQRQERDKHSKRVQTATTKRDFLAANIEAYTPLMEAEFKQGIFNGPHRKYVEDQRTRLSQLNTRLKAYGPVYQHMSF